VSRTLQCSSDEIFNLGPRDHVSDSLIELNWLPIHWRIQYKLNVLMHGIITGNCPAYLRTIVQPATSSHPGLRSAALRQNSSHRDYARSLASVPSATPAHRRGTHFLATSAVQLRHRHLKHCSSLIFFAKLLTLFRTFKFYIVRRLCPKFY